MARRVEIIGLEGISEVKEGDDVARLIIESAENEGVGLRENDIIVITHKIISKANGLIVDLNDVKPSERAIEIGEMTGKDPRFVEIILREAKKILKINPPFVITETYFGHICLNAGIDRSNVAGRADICALLPRDPDAEAKKIREEIMKITGLKKIAVIICDTYSRPHRYAQVDMAIGLSGMKAVRDYKHREDSYGYTLKFKMQGIGDELAGAAELVIGQTTERTPVAVIRGFTWELDEESSAKNLSLIKLGYKCIFDGVKLIPDRPGMEKEEKDDLRD